MDENPNVVNEELTTPQASEATKQVTQPAPAGAKTDSELLLKSLQEERERRRKVEEELNILKQTAPLNNDDEVYSDEGKTLKSKIDLLEERLSTLSEEREIERMLAQYPALKDKASEFKEFRKSEHPRAKVESVAKIFLAENGLLEPKRQGLESPTGGTRTPMTSGMTSEEVKHLRETNYRKYLDMLKKDQIKIDK